MSLPTQARALEEALEIVEGQERVLEEPRVAYLGPAYSNSYEAALQAFPNGKLVPCQTFRSILERLYEGKVDYALLPVRNSIIGPTNEPLGELFEWTNKAPDRVVLAFGVFCLCVRSFIAGKQGSSLGSIKKVYTKDEAHRQCTDWLTSHKLNDHVEHVGSTSQAAEAVAGGKGTGAAAICSLSAVEHNGLVLLAEEPVTDDPTNTTRFLKLKLEGTKAPEPTAGGPAVTLLALVLRDEPGTLQRVLSVFARAGFSLRQLSCAPLKPKMRLSYHFEDWFLFEYEASIEDSRFLQTLRRLRRRTDLCYEVKFLGSFATAREKAHDWPPEPGAP